MRAPTEEGDSSRFRFCWQVRTRSFLLATPAPPPPPGPPGPSTGPSRQASTNADCPRAERCARRAGLGRARNKREKRGLEDSSARGRPRRRCRRRPLTMQPPATPHTTHRPRRASCPSAPSSWASSCSSSSALVRCPMQARPHCAALAPRRLLTTPSRNTRPPTTQRPPNHTPTALLQIVRSATLGN
jgi:hypothetical protein